MEKEFNSKKQIKELKKQDRKEFLELLKSVNFPWVSFIICTLIASGLVYLQQDAYKYNENLINGEFGNGILVKYLVFSLATILLSVPTNIFKTRVECTINERCQSRVWVKFIGLTLKKYDELGPTTLISRVVQDATFAGSYMSMIFEMFVAGFRALGILGVLITMNFKLTAMIIPISFIMIIALIIAGQKLAFRQQKLMTETSKVTSYLSQKLLNIKFIKSENTEKYETYEGYENINNQYKADVSISMLQIPLTMVQQVTQAIVMLVVFVGGGIMLKNGGMNQGQFGTFFIMAIGIPVSFWDLINKLILMTMYKGGTKFVATVNGIPSEKVESNRSFSVLDGDIKFEDVSFTYTDNEENNVIENASFTIPIGKTTAIVGPSGSGKTTVLKLLERYYSPTKGKITFNDIDIEDIHLNEWRNAFGYVVQNSPLLSGTLRENICYGVNNEITDEFFEKIIDLSRLREVVDNLPNSVDTEVGEVGGKLSGGQKQRIAIARALVKNPSYLLLDEATANLDTVNQFEVTEAINNLMKDRTVVVVAHNFSTIQSADKIIVVKNGRICGEGTHEQLYKLNKVYTKLYDLQFQTTL